jgi:DNA modification methylase
MAQEPRRRNNITTIKMKTNTIYNEPCLDTLKKMPDAFLDCVITSPPYWQLRDYGYNGQWGQEPTFQEYLENLWLMMDEIYRVLKPSGTCWINLGDTYGGGHSGKGGNTGKHTEENPNIKGTKFDIGIKKPLNKCLLLIPHRFAIGCIDRGWIVRNDIIWAKRNGMPDSVRDRFTKKHEYFFFMVKSEKYYFDLDSIRDKQISSILPLKTPTNNIWDTKYTSIDNEKEHRQGMHHDRGNNIIEKRPYLPEHKEFVQFLKSRVKMNVLVDSVNIAKTTIEHWYRNDEKGFSYPSVEHWDEIKQYLDNWDEEFESMDYKMTYIEYETDDINKNMDKGKNPGSVSDFWDIPTKPSKETHYAQYSDELIKKPILAGCPENGIVYDPFMGSGSTAEACLRANRQFIGSEMSTEYIKIANKRLEPLLTQVKLF